MHHRNHRFATVGAAALLVLATLLIACRVEEVPPVLATVGPSLVADTPLLSGTPAPQAASATPYPGLLASTPRQASAWVQTVPTTPYPGPAVRTPLAPTSAPSESVPPSPAPATATPAPTRGDSAFTLTILHSGQARGEVLPCG